jgi:hypothetical protein
MIPQMRTRRFFAWVALAALVPACAHEAPAPVAALRPPDVPTLPAAPEPEAPPQYVVGDPARPSALTLIALGPEDSGVLLEGQRFALRAGRVVSARDVADSPIVSGWRVPARLGGGFLFRAHAALYASDTFEGLLRPVVALPAEVTQVSFGPSAALVRADSGERWMIDLATGKRLPIAPPGLLDIAALDDGRAAALVEGGALMVSTDAGGHWLDASPRLRSPAKRLLVDASAGGEAALWIETQSGQSARVMPGGRVAEYDADVPAPTPPSLRPRSPEWREEEPPIRRAVRAGAPFDDGSALVVASGDLVRVDLATGATETLVAGRLPPDALCAGTRVADDLLFTCGRPGGGAFVVSHALDRAPVVEQTFQEPGRFVVTDDGGVAFLGSCDRPSPRDGHMACVRAPGGTWQQYDPDVGAEAGPGATPAIVRWIPRGDGDAIAVVSGIGGVASAWGLVDARTGQLHAWPVEALTPTLQSALQQGADPGSRAGAYDLARLADRSWTVTPQGTLRGWASLQGGTGAIEVGVDGSVQTSPFTFDRVSGAGPLALARLRDGRVWQTVDRGATWSEVAAPSAVKPNGWLDAHACSLVGCDLAQWYRIGWAATPPVALPPPTAAPAAPRLDRSPALAMTCRATGDVRRAAAPRGERSPDDLGLGAARVPVSDPRGRTDFLRLPFGRRVLGPVRDPDSSDDGSPRALVDGPSTQPGDDRLIVMGPSRDAMSLVRQVSFAAAFDPAGTVRRVPLSMPEIVAAARAAGIPLAEALRDDPIPSGVVPITPADPGAADDLLVQLASGGTALLRGGSKPGRSSRIAFEAGRGDDLRIVSGAQLDADAFAWLEEDASGQARVMRLGSSPVPAPVFTLDAPPSGELYPANVDALAVGPRGELAVLRTPSGSEPPSALDPAVLVVPGAAGAAGVVAVTLAPWSTLLPADDPACKADGAAWRVTLQSALPWLRLAGSAEIRAGDDAVMLARVRWSPARVCLEAVELRAADTTPTSQGTSPFGSAWDQALETWVVARYAGGPSAGRVVVTAGAEIHQPLSCSLAAGPGSP